MKCFMCNKKIKLLSIHSCKCGNSYCNSHKSPENHNCTYDYFAEHKKFLLDNNPVVLFKKTDYI